MVWPTLLLLAGCAPPVAGEPVRSSLYPEDWTPGFSDGEGRFLHDFSYAGYHRGEVELPPESGGTLFDVQADFGADASGASDATAALQAAIDAAELAGGGVVHLPAGLYRCDGALSIAASNTTLRGDGPESTRIYFTQSADFSYRSHIAFQGSVNRAADLPLAEDLPNQANVIPVDDASSLSPGDDVALGWVITDDFIAEHGMTGTWTQFNGQWKPFFRREVLSVNLDVTPNEVTLDVPTRYPAKLRDAASLRKESGYLAECVVENLALSDAVNYDTAWAQNQIHLLSLSGVKDAVVRNVTSFVSPFDGNDKGYQIQSGGIMVSDAKRVTVSDCVLEKAQNRGGGGNGYLFEVRQSSEVLYRDCIGRAGRHNFIQNWDFGATGIVWLRCRSEGGQNVTRAGGIELPVRADSEYHHSLATANLVDHCILVDGWGAGNRGTESSGAGISAAQCVVWNVDGAHNGRIRSFNFGNGYVIGTTDATVYVDSDIAFGNLDEGTEPVDFIEHLDNGANLVPQSLYESQRAKRLGLPEQVTAPHSADANKDGRCNFAELLRVIQLYNAADLSCAAPPEATEDGYQTGTGDHTCPPHASDYRLQDWSIDLSELLRLVQIYNVGSYHACETGEDGFCIQRL